VLLNKFLIYFNGFTHSGLFGDGSVVSPYIMVFFLLGLFVKRPNPAANRCYAYILAALLVHSVALSFLYYVEVRYLMTFAPALIGFGAGWFVWQMGQISARPAVRWAVIGVLLCLVLDPLMTAQSLIGRGEFSEQYKSAGQTAYVEEALAHYAPPNAIVVTDIPWATAWYGRHTSILFPATLKELAEIDTQIVPVDAILITTQMNTSFRSQFTRDLDTPWRDLLDNKPPEFPVGAEGKIILFHLADVEKWPRQIAVLYVKGKT
jgi:hypothetical protein